MGERRLVGRNDVRTSGGSRSLQTSSVVCLLLFASSSSRSFTFCVSFAGAVVLAAGEDMRGEAMRGETDAWGRILAADGFPTKDNCYSVEGTP